MNAPNELLRLVSPEAEQSVIGGLLLEPKALDLIAGTISETDFATEAHRRIWRRIELMAAQGMPIDVVTLADSLKAAGEEDRTGGLAYLGELAANTPGASNIRRYAEIVTDRRRLRDLLAASSQIADLARQVGTEPASVRIDRAQEIVLALNQVAQPQAEPAEIGSILSSVIESIEHRFEHQGEISGLRTGFADLDRLTCGLQRGDLIIIAGRPSMGKTTLALNIAEHCALAGGAALVFSMEMSKEQLTERCLASIGRIHLGAIRSGKLSDDDFHRMAIALGKLGDSKLIIDDAAGLTIAQMRARARSVKRRHGLDLIVVDYLQLMGDAGAVNGRSSQNRNEEIGQITRGLKLLARDLDVPVIALSQLSRQVESRNDKRPIMADLRDSGSIEQDADLILMTYRDEYYFKDSNYRGLAEILIRKFRMGQLGEIDLVFQGEYSRFLDAAPGAKREAEEAAQLAKPMARRRHTIND